MKNLPERIFLDLGTPDADDFNNLTQVTWSKDNATGEGIEYVRKDIAELEAEKLAKEFTIFFNRYIIQFKNEISERGGFINLNELFTEFLTSRKK